MSGKADNTTRQAGYAVANAMLRPTPDAVAKAREKYTERVIANYEALRGESGIASEDAAWAEVLAAVRAECAAKVRGFADAYPTDVWPETPFSDAQAASVMRLMVPRILAALEAHP